MESERRTALASVLEKIATLNPFADVDPITWQGEQRLDRVFLVQNLKLINPLLH
jgi:hypothetical protein